MEKRKHLLSVQQSAKKENTIEIGFEEYNVAFTRCLRPEHSAMLRSALASGSRMPWRVEGLPDGVEVQFQKNGDGQILLQLLDYGNNGEIAGHRLLNTATREATDLAAFHVHQLVVLP